METIHYSRCRMMPTPSSLAFRLGYLDGLAQAASGVALKLEFGDYDHGQDRLWVRHASNGKSIWARSRGADTHPIAFSNCESFWPLLARADSGIEDAAGLKGRRVLLPRVKGRLFDVEQQLYLKAIANALASQGLVLGDVKLVEIEFERPKLCDAPPEARNFFEVAADVQAERLLAGEVDAIATVLTPALQARQDLHVVYDSRRDPAAWARGELRMLNASGAMVREHRDVLVDILARLLRAQDWARAHPEAVPQLVATDLQMELPSLQAHDIDFGDWSHVDCSAEQVELMRARKDYLLSVGAIENDFDVAEWIDTSIMKSARDAVRAA